MKGKSLSSPGQAAVSARVPLAILQNWAQRSFWERGARIVSNAIVKDIQTAGGKALPVTVDVTKRAEVEGLVQKAIDTYGKIDVLVNNAGIMPIAPLALLKVDEWESMIDINIKGVLYGVAAALPHMQKQKSGHFINIASVFGIKVFAPGGTVYCATKAAVRTLTEGLRMETHADKIRCTIISPGGRLRIEAKHLR